MLVVDPLHARNMAARLQAATVCGDDRPILLRQEASVGHGQGKPVSRQADELADVLAFLWWQLDQRVPEDAVSYVPGTEQPSLRRATCGERSVVPSWSGAGRGIDVGGYWADRRGRLPTVSTFSDALGPDLRGPRRHLLGADRRGRHREARAGVPRGSDAGEGGTASATTVTVTPGASLTVKVGGVGTNGTVASWIRRPRIGWRASRGRWSPAIRPRAVATAATTAAAGATASPMAPTSRPPAAVAAAGPPASTTARRPCWSPAAVPVARPLARTAGMAGGPPGASARRSATPKAVAVARSQPAAPCGWRRGQWNDVQRRRVRHRRARRWSRSAGATSLRPPVAAEAAASSRWWWRRLR